MGKFNTILLYIYLGLTLALIGLYFYYIPYCPPCAPGVLCPPCVSEKQIVIKKILFNISIAFIAIRIATYVYWRYTKKPDSF